MCGNHREKHLTSNWLFCKERLLLGESHDRSTFISKVEPQISTSISTKNYTTIDYIQMPYPCARKGSIKETNPNTALSVNPYVHKSKIWKMVSSFFFAGKMVSC